MATELPDMKTEAMWTAEAVISELESAMMTLRALPHRGPSTRLAQLQLPTLPDAADCQSSDGALKLPCPSAAAISRMDATLGWLAVVPDDRRALRRIVGLRAQTSLTDRPNSWAAIGREIGADKAAIPRWHGEAIGLIVRRLNAHRVPVPAGGHG